MVQNLRQFCRLGGFCLLVGLHREGSAHAACAAGMFAHRKHRIHIEIETSRWSIFFRYPPIIPLSIYLNFYIWSATQDY